MKKISLAFFLSSSILFATNTIELTGEYAKNLGNPFRVLLEKKDKNISIFSQNKDVILKVESNLDNNYIYSNRLEHPSTYTLKNETIENVVKQFYGEEFNVILGNEKSDVLVNVVSGKVMLTYMDTEQNQIAHLLSKIEVELVVDVIKNGIKLLQPIHSDTQPEVFGQFKSRNFLSVKL